MKPFYPVLFCGLLLAVVASCSRKQTSSGEERLRWNTNTLLAAYEKVGHKDPRWDAQAREALMEMARVRGGMDVAEEERTELAGDLARNAVQKGCDDPLIRYLYCELGGNQSKPLAERQKDSRQMAESMEQSGYPPLRKFYADLATANLLWRGRNTNLWHEVVRWRNQSSQRLAEALAEKALPPEEAGEACLAMLKTASRNGSALDSIWQSIEGPLFQNWPKSASSYLVKGQYHYYQAWRARGGGAASQVKPEGWKLFEERLAIAEEAYLKAWSLDPTDTRIPTQMIEMCVSQKKDEAELNTWFERAMDLAPDNYEACMNKLRYLSPQWYGSAADMVAFGRECVAATNWTGRVPLVLVEAHYRLAGSRRSGSYYLSPDVWPDIKAAYEKFFQLNPRAAGYRSYYALYAFRCAQSQEFLDQIKILRDGVEDINYTLFGGEDQLNQMIEASQLRVGRK